MRLLKWWTEFRHEMKSRRAGHKAMGGNREMFQSARGIVGAGGWGFGKSWDMLEKDDGAYLRSMQSDPVLPPSLFVSERDRTRASGAVPIPERCLEDINNEDKLPLGEWDIAEILNED